MYSMSEKYGIYFLSNQNKKEQYIAALFQEIRNQPFPTITVIVWSKTPFL